MPATPAEVGAADRATFERDGFVVLEALLDAPTVARLNARLERVLRGEHDLRAPPHRAPKARAGAEGTPDARRGAA